MVRINYSQDENNKITVATVDEGNNVSLTVDTADEGSNVSLGGSVSFLYNQAKDWAVKMDGLVMNEDYSSKYYATNASETYEDLQEFAVQSLADISNAETEATNAIGNAGTAAINSILEETATSILAVQSQQTASVNAILTQQTTSVNAVQSEGTTQVNLAKAEVTKATTQANNAKTSEVNALASANSAAEQLELSTAQAIISTEKAEESADSADLAKQWAISSDLVDNLDYSSKYYANISKENALQCEETRGLLQDEYNEYSENLLETKTDIQNTATSAKNTAISAIQSEGTIQVNLAKAEVSKATTQANNAKTSETNASASATSALNYSNNASASAESALNYSNISIEQASIATAQANIAKEEVAKLSTVYKYKGSVATFDDLPTNANVGDVYNTEQLGANYAWTGTEWDSLGGILTATTEWGSVTGSLSNQTDLQNALNEKANSSTLTSHTSNKSNPHAVTKAQIGLGNVDNTSDANKPISTATQTALDGKANASDLTSHTGNKSNPHSVTKAQIGLGNVDNTSDANKPISTATQAALNNKLAVNGTADKALKDKNGKQIDTTYMYKTIGSQSIPNTPTGITRLQMAGKQGCGNGVISGGTLVSLHSNTAYKCYERKGATITCNYDDKVSNLGKTMCDGSYDGYRTTINPSTMFASKPFVWEVVSPSQFEVSDVLRLHLYGHRLSDAVNCTAFKIDAYIQNTLTNTKEWVEVYNYSGTSVNIAQTGWGLYIAGHSTNPYYSIFGVRLTISGSPDTIFRLSEIQLVASRGTEKVCNAIQCLSTDGGKVWGNLEVTGNITSSNTYTKTEVDTKIANSTGTGDGKTITKTSDNKLQAVGVLDARNTSTALKTWTGTRAQYDAITTKNANTIYNITDDTDVTLTLLNTLYPVGAIYIGTCASCPLQVLGVGNWMLKASDMVLQGSGTRAARETVEAGLPNITDELINHSRDYQLNPSLTTSDGVFYNKKSDNGIKTSYPNTAASNSGIYSGDRVMGFDLSRGNSIYGNSDTVQPPAYIVNIWERIS